MAKPIDFPEKTDILKCPEEMPDCTDLPIHRNVLNGFPIVVSCWEFSEQEISDIIKTKRAYIISWSMTHPPLAITGTKPFSPPIENG